MYDIHLVVGIYEMYWFKKIISEKKFTGIFVKEYANTCYSWH